MCHSGMTDGATLNVMPIHRPVATEVSTVMAAPVVQCVTVVWLAAVATAPPDNQLPVQTQVDDDAPKPIDRNAT